MKKSTRLSVLLVLIIVLAIVVFAIFVRPTKNSSSPIAEVRDVKDSVDFPQFTGEMRRYTISPNAVLYWTGKKVGGSHYGVVSIRNGGLAIDQDGTIGGKFVIDMTSIRISDIEPDSPMYDKLLNHLRGGFFAVDQYPTATFLLKQANLSSNNTYQIIGDLTIRDSTHEITFPARLDISDSNVRVQTQFSIDRTRWGINDSIPMVDAYIQFGLDLTLDRL